MRVRGTTGVQFTLKRDASDGGPSTTRSIADADSATGNGTYTFTGLPAGAYTINPTVGAGKELWKTKSVPSAMRASVQGNQEARALLVVRPKQGLGEYQARFTRAVWIYNLTTTTDTDVYVEEYDGIHVQTTTKYVYLKGTKPTREVWNGPAWNGIVSMEPKPFDRYRDASDVVSQPTLLVPWTGKNEANGGWKTFAGLPTGLHSLPSQQPTPDPAPPAMLELFGDLGTRTQQCIGGATPGGSCGTFAWLDHRPAQLGKADSTVAWHSEDGECYLQSSVSGYPISRRLQNGSGHSQRCSRDLKYRNPKTGSTTLIKNFLPKKDGSGGSTMVLSMTQTTICLDCPVYVPPAQGTAGYPDPSATGANPSVGSSNNPPPRTSAPPPTIKYTPPPPKPTPLVPNPPASSPVSLPAAAGVPSIGSGA
jgi:hypothetical protein